MAVLVLALVALVPPALAFAAHAHSTARTALAWSAFYWTPVVLAFAWLVWTNYAITATVDGDHLRVLTLRGHRTLDLTRLDRMRSLSLWGQFGAAHGFRLHTSDGEHSIVIVASQLTFLNRRNVARAQALRAALVPHADRADPRGRSWLAVGPRPSHLRAARHVLLMMLLYFVVALIALLVIAGYITVALH